MITDDDAESAQRFLLDNAKKAGELKGQRIYLEEYRKSLKAILMSDSNGKTQGDKEAHAYSHPKYIEHLAKLRDAVQKDETNRAEREAAVMRISVYQTQSANVRGRI